MIFHVRQLVAFFVLGNASSEWSAGPCEQLGMPPDRISSTSHSSLRRLATPPLFTKALCLHLDLSTIQLATPYTPYENTETFFEEGMPLLFLPFVFLQLSFLLTAFFLFRAGRRITFSFCPRPVFFFVGMVTWFLNQPPSISTQGPQPQFNKMRP